MIPSSGTSGAVVNTTLTVSCNGDVTASTVLCDAHAGPGGTFTLTDGPSAIHFAIGYEDGSAQPTRLNDCAMPGMPLAGVNPSATYKLVAVIPPNGGQLAPGTYTDTVIATVTY